MVDGLVAAEEIGLRVREAFAHEAVEREVVVCGGEIASAGDSRLVASLAYGAGEQLRQVAAVVVAAAVPVEGQADGAAAALIAVGGEVT